MLYYYQSYVSLSWTFSLHSFSSSLPLCSFSRHSLVPMVTDLINEFSCVSLVHVFLQVHMLIVFGALCYACSIILTEIILVLEPLELVKMCQLFMQCHFVRKHYTPVQYTCT